MNPSWGRYVDQSRRVCAGFKPMLWFVKGNCKGHAILNVIRSAGSESEFAGGIHCRRRALFAAERLKSKAVSDVPREGTSDAGVAIAATVAAYGLHLTLLHRSVPRQMGGDWAKLACIGRVALLGRLHHLLKVPARRGETGPEPSHPRSAISSPSHKLHRKSASGRAI